VDLVLLVMNKPGRHELLEDKFTLGRALSVTAGPVGRAAQASTDAQVQLADLAYSRAKGLFAGAAFEGARLHADDSDIEDFYGKESISRKWSGRSGPMPLPSRHGRPRSRAAGGKEAPGVRLIEGLTQSRAQPPLQPLATRQAGDFRALRSAQPIS
jgi:hypothetical protein